VTRVWSDDVLEGDRTLYKIAEDEPNGREKVVEKY